MSTEVLAQRAYPWCRWQLPPFLQRCKTRDSKAHPGCSREWGRGIGRSHLQAQGKTASSLSISYIGLQVTFLLPALDKNPNPHRFVDTFLSRSDNKTSYCRVRVLLYMRAAAAAFVEWFMNLRPCTVHQRNGLCRSTLYFYLYIDVSRTLSLFLLHLHLIPFLPPQLKLKRKYIQDLF